jgi:hypothetical protein
MKIRPIASLLLLSFVIAVCSYEAKSEGESISSPYSFGDPFSSCSSCVPFGMGNNYNLFSQCWGTPANTYCSGIIAKKVRYRIQFPDGSPEIVGDLNAFGQADMGVSCQSACGIGAPYLLKECWPQFYQPEIGRGYFRVTAQGATAVPMLDPQGCCSRGICVPYVWYYYCDSSGAETDLEYEHACRNCYST